MKVQPECYVCAMRQVLAAARLVGGGTDFQIECLASAAEAIASLPRDITPPEIGEPIYRIVSELSGIPDPFAGEKRMQNEMALSRLPTLRRVVEGSEDPLFAALKLSVAGNAIDMGAQESFDFERCVEEALERGGRFEDYQALLERLSSSKSLLYIADNCGEIVFDRLLIEKIRERFSVEAAVAVRGGPIINDVTEIEAREVGLGEICEIVSTGMRMPGTLLEKTTEAFRERFRGADVVISKGQGNWETLEKCEREIFFLLQAKCPVVARLTGCAEGDFLLLHKKPGTEAKTGGW